MQQGAGNSACINNKTNTRRNKNTFFLFSIELRRERTDKPVKLPFGYIFRYFDINTLRFSVTPIFHYFFNKFILRRILLFVYTK